MHHILASNAQYSVRVLILSMAAAKLFVDDMTVKSGYNPRFKYGSIWNFFVQIWFYIRDSVIKMVSGCKLVFCCEEDDDDTMQSQMTSRSKLKIYNKTMIEVNAKIGRCENCDVLDISFWKDIAK